MVKKIFAVLLLMVLVLGLTACGASKVKIGAEENGQSVDLTAGQKLEISLEGNMTTGFSWEVSEIDEAMIKQSGEVEYKSDSKLIGAGGVFTFTFDTVQPGTATLKLIYHRSFEKDVPPAQEYVVIVNVK